MSQPVVLREVARWFALRIEEWNAATLVFSIAPLRRLIGSPFEIASEISRVGHEKKLQANLGIAQNPDSAILAAHYFLGVTVIACGEEQDRLAPLPLSALFAVAPDVDPRLLDVLEQWGLKTTGELAVLSEIILQKRLGPGGVYLRKLALGTVQRPLRLSLQ